MEFSVDLDAAGLGGKKDVLYAAVGGRVASLGKHRCLFHVARTGERKVVTHDVLRALDMSRGFATLDQHTNLACNMIPGLMGKQIPIRQAYEALVEQGLMMSAGDWLAQMETGPHRTEVAEVAGLYVRTCDRPDRLQRLLESIQHANRPDNLRVLVVDDSKLSDNETRNAKVCAELSKAGLDVQHIARAERKNYLTTLQDRLDLDQEQRLAFQWLFALEAIPAFSGGAVWNFILLHSAGRRLLMLDDDFVVEPATHPDTSDKAVLRPSMEETVRFAASDAEINELIEPADLDPFSAHLDVCGYSVAEVLDGEPGRLLSGEDLEGQSLADLDQLTGKSRVLVSANGAYGHSRADGHNWIMLAGDKARGSLLGDADRYASIMAEPRAVVTSPGTYIGRFLAYSPQAMDNSVMLPFAAPLGRGEDYFFAAMIEHIHPDAAFVHLPWCLGHHRDGAHHTSSLDDPWMPTFSRLVAGNARLTAEENMAQDPADRMRWLAATIRGFAQAAPERRQENVEEFTVMMRSSILERLEQRIADAGAPPDYWEYDAGAVLRANGTALTKGEKIEFRDWPGLSLDETQDAASLEATRYATAMEIWPDLWQEAAAINQS